MTIHRQNPAYGLVTSTIHMQVPLKTEHLLSEAFFYRDKLYKIVYSATKKGRKI